MFGISHTESQLTSQILYKASRSLHCTHGRPTLSELYSGRKVGHFSDTLMKCLVFKLATCLEWFCLRRQSHFNCAVFWCFNCSCCFNKTDQRNELKCSSWSRRESVFSFPRSDSCSTNLFLFSHFTQASAGNFLVPKWLENRRFWRFFPFPKL